MKILDRQRFWAFIKAYVICYISFVGLWIVLDAFSNVDEFMKRAVGFKQLMSVMGRFYLIRQADFFDRLANRRDSRCQIIQIPGECRSQFVIARIDSPAREDQRAGRERHCLGAFHHQQFGRAGTLAEQHERRSGDRGQQFGHAPAMTDPPRQGKRLHAARWRRMLGHLGK